MATELTPCWERALVKAGMGLGDYLRTTPFMHLTRGDVSGAVDRAGDVLMRDVIGKDPQTGQIIPPFLGGMTVFHGTPHRWLAEAGFPQGRPRLDKIGTGEGAQAYGHGMYFAENPNVAKSYAREQIGQYSPKADKAHILAASQFRQHGMPVAENLKKAYPDITEAELLAALAEPAKMYSLDLPDEVIPRLLDWDAPLYAQSDPVKVATMDLVDPYQSTGADAMIALQHHLRDMNIIRDQPAHTTLEASQRAVANSLMDMGIPGLQYWDAMSRTPGQGTRNYVIWDQDLLNRMPILGIE